MVKRTLVVTIIFTFTIITAGISYTQEMSFGVNAGISKAVDDVYWNLGFSVGGNVFYSVSPNFSLGGRIAYNRWAPNQDWFVGLHDRDIMYHLNYPPSNQIYWNVSGSGRTIIEIVPSIRILAPTAENQSVNFFGQLGLGFFLINQDVTVYGSYMGSSCEVYDKDSENKPGLSIGGGLTIGKKGSTCFEILPLYHIIFTKDETTKYFSVSAGVVF